MANKTKTVGSIYAMSIFLEYVVSFMEPSLQILTIPSNARYDFVFLNSMDVCILIGVLSLAVPALGFDVDQVAIFEV